MLRKRNARKALCILTAVCLIATGFSMAGPAQSYAADDTQAQYLGKIEVYATVNSRYGNDDKYDDDLYKEITNDYDTNGSYSEGPPLKIGTDGQLAAFAKAVNDGKDFSGRYVKLTATIDLGGTMPEITQTPTGSGSFDITIDNPANHQDGLDKVWTPIGSGKPFKGIFDGGGYTIENMVVCEKEQASLYAGFFGNADHSTIRNLGIEEACVISDNNGTTDFYVGGLAGHSNHSTITSCHAAVDIYANAEQKNPSVYTGGLIGHSDSDNTIGRYGVGNFYVFGDFRVGALIGYNIASNITSCYATGDVFVFGSTAAYAGGLIGQNLNGGIQTCYQNKEAIVTATQGSRSGTINPDGTESTLQEMTGKGEGRASAEKYQVYRATKKSSTYKRISTTSKTALNNIRLTTGKTYYYKVRAYRTVNGKKIYSPFTGIASAKPKPAALSFSLKAGKGRITASWKSVSGATGYRIYRASAKNGKFVLVKDSRGKAKSYTSTKLQNKKTYYYRLRAYRVMDGKKIYSNYTKVKNIQTK